MSILFLFKSRNIGISALLVVFLLTVLDYCDCEALTKINEDQPHQDVVSRIAPLKDTKSYPEKRPAALSHSRTQTYQTRGRRVRTRPLKSIQSPNSHILLDPVSPPLQSPKDLEIKGAKMLATETNTAPKSGKKVVRRIENNSQKQTPKVVSAPIKSATKVVRKIEKNGRVNSHLEKEAPKLVRVQIKPKVALGHNGGQYKAGKHAKPKIPLAAIDPVADNALNHDDDKVAKADRKRSGYVPADKPNWWVKEPKKYMGRTIMGHDPSDPNEKTIKQKLKELGRGGNGTDSSRRIRIIDFGEGAKMNPNAPGWFALKENSEWGKKLTLGTLLRRMEDGSDATPPPKPPMGGNISEGVNKDPSDEMTKLNRDYDRACRYLEYKAYKESVKGPKVSESTRALIHEQNMLLAKYFLDSVMDNSHRDSDGNAIVSQPPSYAFELLRTTKDVFFKFICKDKDYDRMVIPVDDTASGSSGGSSDEADYEPDAGAGSSPIASSTSYGSSTNVPYDSRMDRPLPKFFLEGAFDLFMQLHQFTNSMDPRDYLSEEEFKWIKGYLDECNQTEGKPKKIVWIVDECHDTMISFDEDNKFACTPRPEFDFNIRQYDPLQDFIWHMVTSVHAHCFDSFQQNLRMWHRFAMAMADLFTPQMRLRWASFSEEYKVLYTRLLGPNYNAYFNNMNRCMFASTLRSEVPYLLPRFLDTERGTRFAPRKPIMEGKADGKASSER